MEISTIEELYKVLRRRKRDYLFSGSVLDRLSYLNQQTLNQKEEMMWYLGGPIYWWINQRARKKSDLKFGISKIERKIIHIISNYEVTLKNEQCYLVEKESLTND